MKAGKNKAIFLDRDGVINREKGDYISDPEDFEFNEGIAEALKILSDSGFLIIVVTNQGGIALGKYTHSHVEKLHNILRKELSAVGTELAEIYYCPHHPTEGRCLCRKPGSILFEKAVSRFNIDTTASYMIGDRVRDTQAAEAVGIKGILIKANESIVRHALKIAREVSKTKA
jgi:D-glycero-D-manno-heptose 1,7-bisphosphate phosphatase